MPLTLEKDTQPAGRSMTCAFLKTGLSINWVYLRHRLRYPARIRLPNSQGGLAKLHLHALPENPCRRCWRRNSSQLEEARRALSQNKSNQVYLATNQLRHCLCSEIIELRCGLKALGCTSCLISLLTTFSFNKYTRNINGMKARDYLYAPLPQKSGHTVYMYIYLCWKFLSNRRNNESTKVQTLSVFLEVCLRSRDACLCV